MTGAAASTGVRPAFERRAARAEALARESPSARAPLEFAAGLYRAQGLVAEAIERAAARVGLAGDPARDLGPLAAELRGVLRFAADHAPQPLADLARARLDEDPGPRLAAWWSGGGSGRDDYLARALLRPYAEVLAARALRPQRPGASGGCPFCGGAPWIAARRAAGDGDSAQRFLGCALCASEWPLGRIRCPTCGEESPDKLAAFQSDRHPAVRIEACTTCHTYVKSIDLTVDARAIPEIDDLLSLAMDVWAGEQGYARVEPGLAGI